MHFKHATRRSIRHNPMESSQRPASCRLKIPFRFRVSLYVILVSCLIASFYYSSSSYFRCTAHALHWWEVLQICYQQSQYIDYCKMTNLEDDKFKFVMQTPNDRLSKETRTIIRKQVMNTVTAARRKSDLNKNPSSESRSSTRQDPTLLHLSPPMPISGLELLVKDCGIDPMDLSALTSIHIGSM